MTFEKFKKNIKDQLFTDADSLDEIEEALKVKLTRYEKFINSLRKYFLVQPQSDSLEKLE